MSNSTHGAVTMTPHSSGTRWTLYHGDALSILPLLAAQDVRIDAVITDPPYSSGGAFRADKSADPRKKYLRGDSEQVAYLPTFSGDNRDQRALTLWLSWVLSECMALANPGAALCCFTDWRQVAVTVDALQVGGWLYRGLLPWVKPNARPNGGRFRQSAEFIAWASAGPFRSTGDCLQGYHTASPPHGREHVTEKPHGVLDWLVGIAEPEGLILDPFGGSGSTGEAALSSGRSVIVIEREAAYCDIIARRLEQAETDGTQSKLFG